ncbi:MAG TPA: GreA/GreB family elongation factor, partial [Myxococcales bacterium]|nr:GreA/GreB family elongation factor [Myxococcales bacterium]
IVGEDEADLKKGRISITSPIARGLVGREVGDSVRIRTPGGEREYEILEVSFVEYTVEEGD